MISAILGALGEAAGGLGAATGAVGAAGPSQGFGQLEKEFGKLEATTGKLTGGMTALAPSMQRFVGAVTLLPNQLLQAKAAITTTFDTFVQAFAAPIDTIKHLGDSISRFVRLASPASQTMFDFRVDNAMAAFGRVLVPILDSLGRAADKVNEAVGKLGPVLDDVAGTVTDLVDIMADQLIPAARELAPILESQAFVFKGMAGLAGSAAFSVRALNAALERMGLSLSSLGLLFPGGLDENAGKATAVRQPRLTSIEDIQREASKQSLMASLAAQTGKKPATSESWLEKIHDFLSKTFGKEGLIRFAAFLGAELAKARGGLPRSPAEAARDLGGILAHLR